MEQKALQITVNDEVDVFDVFLSFGKKIERTVKHIFSFIEHIVVGNSPKLWRAIPVRGPNINFYNNYRKGTTL